MNRKKDSRKPVSPPSAAAETAERRRVGKIVRDDRDTATVEWVDAPPNLERIPLTVEGSLARGLRRAPTGYNPYETVAPSKPAPPDSRPAKRDLRKLSAWIKQMREIEERKRRADDEDDDEE